MPKSKNKRKNGKVVKYDPSKKKPQLQTGIMATASDTKRRQVEECKQAIGQIISKIQKDRQEYIGKWTNLRNHIATEVLTNVTKTILDAKDAEGKPKDIVAEAASLSDALVERLVTTELDFQNKRNEEFRDDPDLLEQHLLWMQRYKDLAPEDFIEPEENQESNDSNGETKPEISDSLEPYPTTEEKSAQ